MSLRVSAAVAWVEQDRGMGPEVVVATLPHGPALLLAGSSAVIWMRASEGGTIAEITADIVADYENPPEPVGPAGSDEAAGTAGVTQLVAEEIGRHTAAFLADLRERELLTDDSE